MSKNRPTAEDHARHIRRIRALELRIEGLKTVREIAKELGVSVGTISKDLEWAIRNEAADCPDLIKTHREIEGQRLDVWQAKMIPMLDRAADPDDLKKCLDTLLKISERRAKLFGLDSPVKQEIEATVLTEASPARARALMRQFFSNDVAPEPVASEDGDGNQSDD